MSAYYPAGLRDSSRETPCTGRPLGKPRVPLDVRIWAKIEKTPECWLWTGKLDRDGYGSIAVPRNEQPGRLNYRNLKAHRAVYEVLVGPIGEGLTIDHLCRVRSCVNPAHLEAVSMKVNVLRGINPPANNARKTHCVQGHEFSPLNTKITNQGYRRCRQCISEQSLGRNKNA